jgi:hypothetical protein
MRGPMLIRYQSSIAPEQAMNVSPLLPAGKRTASVW